MELWEDFWKSINNEAYCYTTHNCQSALGIFPFVFSFIDWWWVQDLLWTGCNQKEETENIKAGSQGGLDVKDEKDSFGSVRLIKDLSAWAELSCNLSVVLHLLVHYSKSSLQWDKNWWREINRSDISMLPHWYNRISLETSQNFQIQ